MLDSFCHCLHVLQMTLEMTVAVGDGCLSLWTQNIHFLCVCAGGPKCRTVCFCHTIAKWWPKKHLSIIRKYIRANVLRSDCNPLSAFSPLSDRTAQRVINTAHNGAEAAKMAHVWISWYRRWQCMFGTRLQVQCEVLWARSSLFCPSRLLQYGPDTNIVLNNSAPC